MYGNAVNPVCKPWVYTLFEDTEKGEWAPQRSSIKVYYTPTSTLFGGWVGDRVAVGLSLILSLILLLILLSKV